MVFVKTKDPKIDFMGQGTAKSTLYFSLIILNFILTLTRPLRSKLRMRWFFDVSKVKESSFLKLDLTDPP